MTSRKEWVMFNTLPSETQEKVLERFERRLGMKGDTWVRKYPYDFAGIKDGKVYTTEQVIKQNT